jgi:DNA-directed RNA polymerase specialized sigma24 family protein
MPAKPIEMLLSDLTPQLRQIACRSTSAEVRQSADDIISDLYLKMSRRPVPSHVNPESYTVKIFKNLMWDYARSCNRRAIRGVEFMRVDPQTRLDGADTSRMGCRETYLHAKRLGRADAEANRHDLRLHIKRAMRKAKIRRDHRCALRAWLRDSLDEFAERNGITRKTAAVWACRARKALKPYLEHLRDDVLQSVSSRKSC